jgi:DNA-binding SARP family transcriptional activator
MRGQAVISLRLLGPPQLEIGGEEAPTELLWRKHLALLVYLHCAGRRGATRAALLDLLWGEKPEAAARHSLNEALRVIRRSAGDGAIATDGEQVSLTAEVDSDLRRVEGLLARQEWSAAAAEIGGEFLEGFEVPGAQPFGDWLLAMRTEWRRRGADLLSREGEQHLQRGDAEGAAALGERAGRLDPQSEAAVELTIRSHALRSDRAAALAAFDRHAGLQQELGLPPSARLVRLAERVRSVRREPVRAGDGPLDRTRRPPLVGRDQELHRLSSAWAAANGGHAAVAIIRGDPGTGRSRLLEELAERARLEGATVLFLRAVPADRTDPLGGLRSLTGGGLLQAPAIAAAPAEALGTLAAAHPAWAERFPAARPEAALTFRQAVIEILRATLEEAPVMLAVDDAQWLDDDSLEALLALPRDLAGSRLLLAATAWRAPSPPPLDAAEAMLGRGLEGSSVTASPLPLPALGRLVKEAFPAYPPEASARLARRIAVDSAGLPLLAVELVHAIAGGLELREEATPWPEAARTLDQTLPGSLPDNVVAAIRLGFRRLSGTAQQVLSALAVLEEREPATRLGIAASVEPRALEAALDELEWQRWLRAELRGYVYVARIAREVVGRDLVTRGQRARMRERVGAA